MRAALIAERDITTLSAKTLETFATETGHAEVRRLLDEGQARSWIEGRQLIDLVEAFPVSLTAEQLTTLTRPLPPRAYSIASSRKEVGEEAHLLIAAVRYETHGRARGGVASTFVADRLKTGAAARVRLKPNKHFRLPDPSDRHHHDRPRHGHRPLPRLRAGTARRSERAADPGCSSATGTTRTTSCISSNGRMP